VIDLGFRPRDWQASCFRALKRFSFLVVHRRGGKTVLAVMRLIDAALRLELPMGRYGYLAPQLKQAKRIAWRYLKHYGRKIPGTKISESDLTVEFPNGAQIAIMGGDRADTIRGDYFDGVVIDEVAQIKPYLWGSVIRPMLADRQGWALFIGTPQGINLLSQLYYSALADPSWYTALFTCYDTDALPAAEIESMRTDPNMSETQFRQEMLCDFTAQSVNTLISIEHALAATKRILEARLYDFAPRILGVDVAWQGGDRCALFRRQGLQSWKPTVIPGLPEKTFWGIVAREIQVWRPHMTFVDVTGGYGGEVVSRLHDAGHKQVQGINFAWKAKNSRYFNLRSEMWANMADWVKEGGSIPNDHGLMAELCAPTYSNDNVTNKFKLESKDEIRERLGFSPDMADALALTWAMPVAIPEDDRPATPKRKPGPWS
jgi:Terminase large subunit, T4likevirus-type, N-terminal